MKKAVYFLTVVLLAVFSCKSPDNNSVKPQNVELPPDFYKHMKGTYFNMPATLNITAVDTFAYITLVYGKDYRTIQATIDDFKSGKFTYHLLQNLKTRDTVETWFGKFTSDSTLALRVKIPVRDTVYTFTEDYAQSAKIHVYRFDTTIYYPNSDQEILIVQTNSLTVDGLHFHFFNNYDQLKQQFDSVYNSIIDLTKDYNPNSSNYFFPFYYNRIMTVEYNDNNLLVVSDNVYLYLGGAHGMNNISYYNIDLKTGKLLKLPDIIKDTNALKKLIYNQLEEQNRFLFVTGDNLPLPSNFYISGKNLMLIYNPYEIAPYSEGQITVEFSFKDLKDIIDSGFIKTYFP